MRSSHVDDVSWTCDVELGSELGPFFTQYSTTGAGEPHHIDQSASSGPVRSGRIVVSSGSIPYTIGLFKNAAWIPAPRRVGGSFRHMTLFMSRQALLRKEAGGVGVVGLDPIERL